MWADVMVDKVRTTLHLGAEQDNHADATSVSFYLLPAVSEYCLLSVALIYEITVRIGQPSYIELEDEEETEGGASHDGEGTKSGHTSDGENPTVETANHTAHKTKQLPAFTKRSFSRVLSTCIVKVKVGVSRCGTNIKSGYWAPLLIVVAVSVLTIVTGVSPGTSKIMAWKCAVLFSEEMFLNCMGIFVTLASFFKVRRLKFTIAPRQSVIDEFVLYIAFFFSANYLVATVALTSYFNRVENSPYKDLLMGRLALNMLELIEVILQTYLIQDCFRRCSEEASQQRIKPGRQMIAVLLGINLASWVVKSFQLKEADILYNMTNDNGDIAYGWVLIAITMPVFLFYRYHCTVCLSQAFTMLYEDETRRFEALWRQNPIYLANLLSHTNLAMCEDGSHLQASENPASIRMSGRRLNEMLHRKFSTQSFQQLEYMMPRRASFFHPGAMSASSSAHDTDLFYTPHHGMQPCPVAVIHKMPALCTQKKLSVPNLKRPNVPGAKASLKISHPSRSRLTESESFEGPNYFLSRISPAGSVPIVKNEHSTQTIAFPYDQRHQPPNTAYQSHLRSVLRSQQPARSNGEPARGSSSMVENKFENSQPPEADGMQRRQTLVNLETAKYRFLAAEMAHKRVLERSGEGGVEGGKKRSTRRPKSRRKRGPAPKSPGSEKKGSSSQKTNPQSTEPVTSSPPLNFSQPSGPSTPPPPLHPVRGFEPSKVVPLLIARSISNQSDGAPLSVVPEEGGHDFNLTPSPSLVHTLLPVQSASAVQLSEEEASNVTSHHSDTFQPPEKENASEYLGPYRRESVQTDILEAKVESGANSSVVEEFEAEDVSSISSFTTGEAPVTPALDDTNYCDQTDTNKKCP
uniref:Otopetrin n=1 Tax=Mesocestoides corti TaxID=53468 RepID=A0A5K3EXZ8_MESCO